jgi:predicted Rossmann-fold nucleotide-binding protein
MDEFFEVLTLVQTKKLKRPLPIVLFGAKYWNEVVNFDALVKYRTINAEDLNLFLRTDSVDEAFDYLTQRLVTQAIDKPGGSL